MISYLKVNPSLGALLRLVVVVDDGLPASVEDEPAFVPRAELGAAHFVEITAA